MSGLLINQYTYAVPSNPYTKLLMHFDGADGGTTFTDSSQYARAISRTGTVTTSNIQSKFGGTSLKNLNEGALIIPNSSDFNLGLNDFTIECWVYILSYNTFNTVLDATNSPSGAIWRFWASYSGSSNKVNFYGVTSSVAVSLNTWTHIAVSRVSGSTKVYVNGVGGTAVTLGNIASNNSNIVIGKTDTFGSNMYIDELRVRVGEAVYTSNFTPPAAPFTS